MKQGINYLMRVKVDFDLDTVDKILFKASQKGASKIWTYPSDDAKRVESEENVIELRWNWTDTYAFTPSAKVQLDSKIFVTGSDYNPPTKIAEFVMDATNFTEEELNG